MFAEFFTPEQIGIVTQIILIDLVLAGDNANIIGKVASKYPQDQTKKNILWEKESLTNLLLAFLIYAPTCAFISLNVYLILILFAIYLNRDFVLTFFTRLLQKNNEDKNKLSEKKWQNIEQHFNLKKGVQRLQR